MTNRFRLPLGAPGRSGDMPRRAQRELGTPSWAVSDAKLAVLVAMLAVLDAKLAAQDVPNSAGEHPGALFEHIRELERRSR